MESKIDQIEHWDRHNYLFLDFLLLIIEFIQRTVMNLKGEK